MGLKVIGHKEALAEVNANKVAKEGCRKIQTGPVQLGASKR